MAEILFPDDKIIVTKHFDAHQDWEIPIPGFFIIAAKRKIKSIGEFNNEEQEEFIKLIYRLRKGMKELLKIKHVYLFQREDSEHSFHIWMLPRHEWMEKIGRKAESVKPILTYAKEHMKTEEVKKEVKDAVKKMKKYMKDF